MQTTFTLRVLAQLKQEKLIFKSWMPCLAILLACICVNGRVSAQGLTDLPPDNFKTFTATPAYGNMAKLRLVNTERDYTHPDFGKLAPGANPSWLEQYSKRTATSRSFISANNEVVYEYAYSPVNYLDANGNYVAINPKLAPLADHKGWAALQQEFPTYLNTDGSTEITVGKDKKVQYNLRSTVGGEAISIKNFTVGDNGIIIREALPGVDKKIQFGENRIETDYILNSPLKNISTDLILTEEIQLPTGYTMKEKNLGDYFGTGTHVNEMVVLDELGRECAHFKVPVIYDSKGGTDVSAKADISTASIASLTGRSLPSSICFGKYNLHLENNKLLLDVIVPAAWLNDPSRVYPITIDPVVTGPTATWAGGNFASCFYPSFTSATITVTVPAGVTMTNLYVTTSLVAKTLSLAIKNDGLLYLTSSCGRDPNDTAFFYRCPNDGLAGTCYLENLDVASTLGCCATSPSCVDQTLDLTMWLSRVWGGAGCNQTYIYYNAASGYPFSAYVVGRTVEAANTWTITPSTVCSDVCNMTLNATANYGVPPYTMSHPWTSSTITFGSHTVNSCSSTGSGSLLLTNPACPATCGGVQSVSVPAPTIIDACGNTVSGLTAKNITVNPKPVLTATPTSLAVCSGDLISVGLGSCVSSSTITWVGSNGSNGTNDISDNQINNGTLPITVNYSVQVVSPNGCIGDSIVVPVTVNPNPVVTASPASSTICNGQFVNLTATGGTAYSWTNASGLSDSTIADPVAGPSATTSYTVIATDGNNCTGSANVSITVNTSLNVTISPDTSVCMGAGVQISAAGGTIYSWSPASDLSDPAIPDPISNPTTTTTYTAFVSNANGCSNTASVTVNVTNPPLLAPSQTNVTCFGKNNGDATVNAAGSTPFSYLWSNAETSQSVSALAAGTYSVLVTDSNGCTSNNTFTISEPAQIVLNFKRDYYVCDESGTVQLTASGGTSYLWSPGWDLSDSTVADPFANPLFTTTYTVTVINGPCSDTAHVTIHIVSAPSPPKIKQNGDTLSVPTGYVAYQWYFSGTPIVGANNYFYIANQPGLYSVYLTDTNGCKVTAQGVTFVEVTAIHSQSDGIWIYPNPAGNEFIIRSSMFEKNVSVDLFNVLGEKIYSRNCEFRLNDFEQTIDISSLAKGIYFVQIYSKEKSYRSKLMKE